MERILLAEDDDALRDIVQLILQAEGYQVTSVANGQAALDMFDQCQPDLLVSDISMPKMDGFALLEAVRSRINGAAIPVLFISTRSERSDVQHARRLGVDDYLFKPFESQELLDAVRIRLDRRHAAQLFDTREAHLQTVRMLANAVEARDPYTRGHVERVCNYALALGRALDWPSECLVVLEFGAILHDIGKIVVPSSVLGKGSPLTPEEQTLMRQHVEAGARMLKGVSHLQAAIPYVLFHHERWDGSGYPYGLSGEKIPLEGRLLAVADAYDAMTSDRPYHARMTKKIAVEKIRRGAGIHFDPFIVDAFIKIVGDVDSHL